VHEFRAVSAAARGASSSQGHAARLSSDSARVSPAALSLRSFRTARNPAFPPRRENGISGNRRTAGERAATLLLFAALWLLVFALMVVGQWRRMELDARTDAGEWGER
jgi:ferric-dicitrate binding protein FerR (iron transport regulator)